MPKLEDAILLATAAHHGQTDKAGQPYILHPLRVAMNFTDETEQITAVLHDVAEDTGVQLDVLAEVGFGSDIIEALDCLTRRKDQETYEAYISRIIAGPRLAQRVKFFDLKDNMNLQRMALLGEAGKPLLARYYAAFNRISLHDTTLWRK